MSLISFCPWKSTEEFAVFSCPFASDRLFSNEVDDQRSPVEKKCVKSLSIAALDD